MEILRQNLELLPSLKKIVETKNTDYYSHKTINNNEITSNTISIIMTTHERSTQLYFTMDTINRCSFKDIQVIIVDDSHNDPLDINILSKYSFNIEVISINRDKKIWANPCINYNIGFQYIKGGKVIIQNGEVCYVGDILEYVNKNVIDNNYYIFDVKASRDFSTNDIVYSYDNLDCDIYNKHIWMNAFGGGWYHHSVYRNVQYHFLTAMTRNVFDRLKGFSYDYSFGSSWDDNDFLIKIRKESIPMINVKSEEYKVGGIHLYHGYTENISDHRAYKNPCNRQLFYKKTRYYNINKDYLELSDYDNIDILVEMYDKLAKY